MEQALTNAYRKGILDHYDVEEGAGNAYKFLASWINIVQVFLFGWRQTLSHPAVLHYGLDHIKGKNIEESLYRLHAEAWALLQITRPSRILDAGCGLGGMTLDLGRQHPNMQFVGVSLSPGQIRVAKDRVKNAGITNVSYVVANYLHVPEKVRSFDGITAIETFCHVENADKPALFKELFRLLKPGGRLVIFDGYIHPNEKEWKLKPLHKVIADGWSLPTPISTAPYIVNCAKRAGFRVVQNTEITSRVLVFSFAIKELVRHVMMFRPWITWAIQMRHSYGIRVPVFSQLGLDHPAVLGVADTASLQYDLLAVGDVEYRIMVFEKSKNGI